MGGKPQEPSPREKSWRSAGERAFRFTATRRDAADRLQDSLKTRPKKTPVQPFAAPESRSLTAPHLQGYGVLIGLLLRHDHRVDDMDHAVGGGDVGGRDIGAVDADLAAFDHDLHGLTLYGLGLCELDDISRLH